MTKQEFCESLDELLGLKNGTLKGGETLQDLDAWDSLMVVNFLAFADEKFNLTLPPKKVAECKTVNDLATLLGDNVK